MTMQVKNWQVQPKDLFAMGPIVPVLVINEVADALPIAEALLTAGINVLEVTLRTPNALDVISAIAKELPEAVVGSGTVTNRVLLQQSYDAGAKFAISPGLTKDLLQAGDEGEIALIPGISSISELMDGIDFGYDHFKFFPAEASGGVKAIQSIGGPFPDVKFCPTGGINLNNIKKIASTGVDRVSIGMLTLPNIPANISTISSAIAVRFLSTKNSIIKFN